MAQLDTLKKKNKISEKAIKQDQEKKRPCLEFVIPLTHISCFHLYPSATPQNIPIFINSLFPKHTMYLKSMWAFWAFGFSTSKQITRTFSPPPTLYYSLHIYPLYFFPVLIKTISFQQYSSL